MGSTSTSVTSGHTSWTIWTLRAGEAGPAIKAWQNAYNPSANYGNSNFDVRNAFKGYVFISCPLGGQAVPEQQLCCSMQLSAVGRFKYIIVQSGQPFTPVMSNGSNSYASGGGGFAWYPNLIGNPNLANRGVKQWFNEAAFAVPASGTFGNERRNQLTGPGLSTVNLSLGKTFAIWEQVRYRFVLMRTMYSIIASFALPNNSLSLTGSAISTGTSNISATSVPMRNMQLSARITF